MEHCRFILDFGNGGPSLQNSTESLTLSQDNPNSLLTDSPDVKRSLNSLIRASPSRFPFSFHISPVEVAQTRPTVVPESMHENAHRGIPRESPEPEMAGVSPPRAPHGMSIRWNTIHRQGRIDADAAMAG